MAIKLVLMVCIASGFSIISYAVPVTNNLELWLDASDVGTLFQDTSGLTPVTGDGDSVGLWADKSGNNRHAVANWGLLPTYQATGFSGSSGLAFTRSGTGGGVIDVPNSQLTVPGVGISSGNARTIFMILQTTGLRNQAFFGTATAQNIAYDGINGLMVLRNGGLLALSASGSMPPSQYAIVGIETTATYTNVDVNGERIIDANPQNHAVALLANVGIGGSNFGDRGFAGLIAETLVYSKVLSAEEYEQVSNYASSKYGIAVPEPTSMILCVLMGLPCVMKRRRKI